MGFITGTVQQDMPQEFDFRQRAGTVWQYASVGGDRGFYRYDLVFPEASRYVYTVPYRLGDVPLEALMATLVELQKAGVKFTATDDCYDELNRTFRKMNEDLNAEDHLEISPPSEFEGVVTEGSPDSVPQLQDAFTTELTPFASGLPIQAAAAAIMGKDDRGEEDNKWHLAWHGDHQVATYRHPEGRGGYIAILSATPKGLSSEYVPGDLGWALVDGLDFDALWIHLILSAHAMKLDDPTRDTFYISAQQIAHYLGYPHRRKDKTMADILRELEESMGPLSGLGIRLVNVRVYEDKADKKGKIQRGKYTITEDIDRLWDIGIAREWQGKLGSRPELTGLVWRVRPGMWAHHYLTPSGMRQFGHLSQSVLRIDPYHYPLAAKLAVYLQLQGRIKLAKGQKLVYSMRTLLEAIHEMPDAQAGQSKHAVSQARSNKRRQLIEAIEKVLPKYDIITGGPKDTGYNWLDDKSGKHLTWKKWLEVRVELFMPNIRAQPENHSNIPTLKATASRQRKGG